MECLKCLQPIGEEGALMKEAITRLILKRYKEMESEIQA